MKGVILAGGNGTRLQPLTYGVTKHLLPIGRKPMILYPFNILEQLEIKDVCIVSSEDGAVQIEKFFNNYPHNSNISYMVQEEADGIGGALRLAKDFVGDDHCLVILGDNIFFDIPDISDPPDCRVFAYKVDDVSQLGSINFDVTGKIESIIEKPKDQKEGCAAIGIYVFSSLVFEIINSMSKSARGEYEITDINNEFIKMGKADCRFLEAPWLDAGTFEDYENANDWMRIK